MAKLITTFLSLTILLSIKSQPLLEWERWYRGPAQEDEIRAIAVDDFGNIYVTGRSDGDTTPLINWDWVTISYDPSGIERWLVRIESPLFQDIPFDLKLNKQNEVYIAGTFQGGWRIEKRNYLGELVWERTYPIGFAKALVLDREGNIYVTGESAKDIQTVRYSPEGFEQWRTVLRTPEEEVASAIALDSNGNVFVTGRTGWECITIKYDASGNVEWVSEYPNGVGRAIEVDLEGNVCVAAYSDSDFVTIKYDTYGNVQWVRRYGDPGVSDQPNDLLVDEEGNIYITGASKSYRTSSDFLTIKYNPEGETEWVRWFDYQNSEDGAWNITMDNLGHIFIAGRSESPTGTQRIIGVKYTREGTEDWAVIYEGGVSGFWWYADLATDPLGNVYIAGGLPNPDDGNLDYITLKYKVSDSPFATYPNQSRHLIKAINTSDFHLAYEGHEKRIVWQLRSENMNPSFFIDKGKFPSIALSQGFSPTNSGLPWITYTTGNSLVATIKRDQTLPGNWTKKVISSADEIGAPSLVLSQVASIIPEASELGYVVYEVKSFSEGRNYIYFTAFDSLEVYYTAVLDTGEIPNGSAVYPPSIAITPGDYLHIVWCKGGRVWYKTTLQPVYPEKIREGIEPVWSEKVAVSTQSPLTEPASNPSIEAYGDYVYCVWRGPNDAGDPTFGDVWQRRRRLTHPVGAWQPPENLSRTLMNESNFPVKSTNFATVWQESIAGNNWDIWVKFEDEPSSRPLIQTLNPSLFPQIYGYWDYDLTQPIIVRYFILNTIWTEELRTSPSPLYEVRFNRYLRPNYDTDVPKFYSVEGGGENPSPYCEKRDGYIQYGQYSIDYDEENLVYRLKYLDPRYYYLMRAVVYRRGQNNWIEDFYSDTALIATLTVEPNHPETLWFILPRESYENCEAVLEIEKVVGSFASLADLTLFQLDDILREFGGGQSARNFLNRRPSLEKPSPNPFQRRTTIRYQIPDKGKVSITIYDASGRMVKELLNEDKEAGSYAIFWDGKDDKGNSLPPGIYFYRLKSNRFTDTKRAILVR